MYQNRKKKRKCLVRKNSIWRKLYKNVALLNTAVISIWFGYYKTNAPINVMPAKRGRRQGMGWDLIVFVDPGVGHLTDLVLLRGGDIWIFLRPTWRYLTADSNEKDWDRTYVSPFHASRMRRTVWKDLEIMEAANGNKRKLGGFHCFVSKFRLL